MPEDPETQVGPMISSGQRETVEGYMVANAHVPLSEMFGYSTDLRSATQGKGEFSMEFAKYQPVPRATQEQMIKEFREKQAAAKK